MIGIASGNFIKLGWSLKKSLSAIKQAGCDAVELTFAKVEELEEVDEETINLARSFEYRSIHIPFKVDYSGPCEAVVEQILSLGRRIDTDNYTAHPRDIDNMDKLLPLYKTGKLSVENMDRKLNIPLDVYKLYLEKYPKLGFVLDTTHAGSIVGELVKLSKWVEKTGRVRQLHISVFHERNHHPLRFADKEFFSIIQKFKCPYILEVKYMDDKEYLNDVKILMEMR